MDGHLNRWFLDPLLRGRYPADMLALYEGLYGPAESVRDGDLAVIRGPIDFLGVNYYNPQRIAAAPASCPSRPAQVPSAAADHGDGLGGRPRRPARRPHAPAPRLRPAARLHHRERRVLRRPAGQSTATSRTRERTAYLQGHLAALARAVADGADVRRYCVWSLMDNFEWEEGYDKRFGIVHVDFATQRRVPKQQRAVVPRLHRPRPHGRRKLMAQLAFEGVTKVFADGTEAVQRLRPRRG